MAELRICPCGAEYWWPGQRWVHEKCVVVNAVVVNRGKDRHRRTPERAEYVRQKMREYRLRKRAA